ncbi:MAG: transcriptional repressor NrdR [Myxococcales bacterium]|nr:transcriptional repressor NrdR [Myxococcales bacterium]
MRSRGRASRGAGTRDEWGRSRRSRPATGGRPRRTGAEAVLCPVCRSASTKVLDSRDGRDGLSVRRRRSCNACGHRFTTHERIEETLPMVVKRDGSRQAFDRGKLLRGLQLACRKRPVRRELLDAVVQQVEQWSSTRGDRELHAAEIGERVMHHLYELDEVAYVRFVSVYRSFESVAEFAGLLREMEKAEKVDPEGQRTLFEALARRDE